MAYIGDVAHITHGVTQVTEIAEQHIESNCRTCMPEMAVAINRRAAHIHSHPSLMKGTEQFLAPRKGVIDAQIMLFHR